MKQIVDFEQAKRLALSGVYIGNVLNYQPTIGELIEWICEHRQINGTRQLFEVSEYLNKMGIWRSELINALVELAIKIKENK